ncbi:cytidine deaminase-like protein [Lipomyces kononenkoae]|uniref:Cytidine deaminase-like protein n=1 Tax=Lipomyces kononenkoae TaxID=34357 RepID=A0ACC3TB80_LIPKO
MPPSVGSSRTTTASTTGTETYLHHKHSHSHHGRHHISLSSSLNASPSTTVAGVSGVLGPGKGHLLTNSSTRSFVQVRLPHEREELELVDVWATLIPARIASSVISHLRQELPNDPHSLLHLRRLVKETEINLQDSAHKASEQVFLHMLICSIDAVPSEDEIRRTLQPMTELLAAKISDDRLFVPVIRKAPKYPALTKQQSKEWSNGTWPIMWRGNPHAIISELPSEDELLYKNHIERLLQLTEKACNEGEIPIATLIVDPVTSEIVASAVDTRNSSNNPLAHSTMTCIAKVAENERRRRECEVATREGTTEQLPQAYLCHNLQLITTHEPCAMCSMAMVHSRISRLVYIKNMPQSGGIDRSSGAGYGIHWNKQLNWRFEAWKWEGQDILMYDIGDAINA